MGTRYRLTYSPIFIELSLFPRSPGYRSAIISNQSLVNAAAYSFHGSGIEYVLSTVIIKLALMIDDTVTAVTPARCTALHAYLLRGAHSSRINFLWFHRLCGFQLVQKSSQSILNSWSTITITFLCWRILKILHGVIYRMVLKLNIFKCLYLPFFIVSNLSSATI